MNDLRTLGFFFKCYFHLLIDIQILFHLIRYKNVRAYTYPIVCTIKNVKLHICITFWFMYPMMLANALLKGIDKYKASYLCYNENTWNKNSRKTLTNVNLTIKHSGEWKHTSIPACQVRLKSVCMCVWGGRGYFNRPPQRIQYMESARCVSS